eukprot:TRINITY_DN1735_c0_g1_i1.p1 TRINITY_DN1735_c0_g1~~TRINITY_DN1735_c0_g1_i1.p1  ORF type:complete len:379 (+),score=155.67 TRINITY_DN1735_c0_g1_i1:116-1138(+)
MRGHRCGTGDAPEERNLKAYTKNGVTWRAGVRVVIRCCLAGVDKMEHAAGASGCVWEVLPDGLLMLCMDNDRCDVMLVEAEVADVEPHKMLAQQAPVKCREILVRGTADKDRDTLKVIPQGTPALVVAYYASRNTYSVRFPALNVIAEVATNEVQPAKPREKPVPPPLQLDAAVFRESSNRSTPEQASLNTSLRNLTKTPSYSNLSGSPRARKQGSSPQHKAGGVVTFDAASCSPRADRRHSPIHRQRPHASPWKIVTQAVEQLEAVCRNQTNAAAAAPAAAQMQVQREKQQQQQQQQQQQRSISHRTADRRAAASRPGSCHAEAVATTSRRDKPLHAHH